MTIENNQILIERIKIINGGCAGCMGGDCAGCRLVKATRFKKTVQVKSQITTIFSEPPTFYSFEEKQQPMEVVCRFCGRTYQTFCHLSNCSHCGKELLKDGM